MQQHVAHGIMVENGCLSARRWITRTLIILPTILCFVASSVEGFEIPLPGGRRIKFEDGGVVRIQLDDQTSLPKAPSMGTRPLESALSCIQIRDTGTAKGFGAFCSDSLPKTTFLGFYEGELVTSRESLDRSFNNQISMDYVVSVDGGYTFLDGYKRAQNRDVFSPVHLNHADKESEGCNCLRVLSQSQVAFFTSREVKAGEELCFDYGGNYWKGRENEKV